MDAHTHWHRTDLQHRILYSSHYGKLQQAAIYHLFTNNGKFMHRTNLQSFSHRSITKFIQQSVWSNTIYINHKIANTHPSFQLCVCVCVCVCVHMSHTYIHTILLSAMWYQYLCGRIWFSRFPVVEMNENVIFVVAVSMSCLYSTVSLTRVWEWCCIRMTYHYHLTTHASPIGLRTVLCKTDLSLLLSSSNNPCLTHRFENGAV